MMQTKTCKQRVDAHWISRKKDLIEFIDSENYEGLDEYFLEAAEVEAIPAVSPKGLHLQHAPFKKLLISWGGPSEEIRFYEDGIAEFVLLDWGDKAEIEIAPKGDLGDDLIAHFLRDYFFDV